MKISVILAHPDGNSFNHAISSTVVDTLTGNGHEVCFHDLYEEQFDALLPTNEFQRDTALPPMIRKHCDEISEADGIVVIHPNWWGQPPAILKGWVDRVIRPGVAYEFLEGDSGDGVPNGLLKAKSAVVFNTSNTKTEREERVFSDPLETIWKNCIFDLCGISDFHRRMYNIVIISTAEQRKEWLRDVSETVGKVYPPTVQSEE